MSSLVLIDAGGTIASMPDADGVLIGRDGSAGLAGTLSRPVIERQAYAGLSEDMTMVDAMRIVGLIGEAAGQGARGVVVTHGTDTMEEVAFLAGLFHGGAMPVVFTGAQRAPSLPGYDGAANLRDAVAVADREDARGIGVAIVFAGRVLAARGATKRDSSAPDAFGPESAVIARVDEQGVRWSSRPIRPAPLPPCEPDPSVHIVSLGLASGPELIDAMVDAGARGLVLEGFGRGNVPMSLLPAVERAQAAGLVIGLASHCPEGGVAPTYASGARLAQAGVIGGGDLSARKLRLLLAVALGDGRNGAQATHIAQAWLTS
ncbi:L-asparaginase [Novosphingobium chloroacetimidivorans]|uniref:L-asparaginase n=1 Tax=Novosphingobium chloroacetimidivorans TaxID=1428314 RepID=A0A7W7K7B7_9SPHN|nr:asparaginase [Novosphingobium chloroacetimidivorans]MBB4857552.1 L-asparaginase [Novosphingobium chloroacetimidivorans]